MKTFKCEEMMCDHCVSRINTALNEAKIAHSVDLASKTVTIEHEAEDAAKAAEILDDLGFTPAEM